MISSENDWINIIIIVNKFSTLILSDLFLVKTDRKA